MHSRSSIQLSSQQSTEWGGRWLGGWTHICSDVLKLFRSYCRFTYFQISASIVELALLLGMCSFPTLCDTGNEANTYLSKTNIAQHRRMITSSEPSINHSAFLSFLPMTSNDHSTKLLPWAAHWDRPIRILCTVFGIVNINRIVAPWRMSCTPRGSCLDLFLHHSVGQLLF